MISVLLSVYCPGQEKCVDLARCKTECVKVAEGTLFEDRSLLAHLNQIHCGVGEDEVPFVCCDKEAISEEVFCGGILEDMLLGKKDVELAGNERVAEEQEKDAIENKKEDIVEIVEEEEEEEDLLERGECGVRRVFSFHIAGGVDTKPGDWPWMARLIYGDKDDQQLCGGELYFPHYTKTVMFCTTSLLSSLCSIFS